MFENAVEGSGGKIVTGLARNRDPAQPGRMLELTMASLVAARYQPSSCSNRNTSLTFMSICAAGADPNCPNGGVLDLQDEAFELQPAGNLERRADRRACSNDDHDVGLQAGLDGMVVTWAGELYPVSAGPSLFREQSSACLTRRSASYGSAIAAVPEWLGEGAHRRGLTGIATKGGG